MYTPAMTTIEGKYEYDPRSVDPGTCVHKKLVIPRFRKDIPRYKVDGEKKT